MGKGLAKRRRMKRAVEANQGNLAKAMNGKASARLPLPAAPKKHELLDKLPASLRKMMALKAAAQKEDAAKGKDKSSQPMAADAGAAGRHHQQDQHDSAKPSASGRREDSHSAATTSAAKGTTKSSGQAEDKVYRDLFDTTGKKTLKEKKKLYLKKKEMKKKHKGKVDEDELEALLKMRQQVKFGEQADAPLDIHLKRKHWVQQEKASNERCKQIFLKQMNQAQEQLPGSTMPKVQHRHGHKKSTAAQDEGRDKLRQEVIQAYRAQKNQVTMGSATLDTLARLVKKSS